ncbi:MAG: hypothetical protein AB8B97_05480 [Granulosicoccus sp.]
MATGCRPACWNGVVGRLPISVELPCRKVLYLLHDSGYSLMVGFFDGVNVDHWRQCLGHAWVQQQFDSGIYPVWRMNKEPAELAIGIFVPG